MFLGIGPNHAPLYFGTALKSPTIEIVRNYEPLSNDIGGAEPIDDSYQGQSARIEYEANVWNEAVVALLEKTNPFSPSPRGVDDFGDVGSIMQLEGKSYPLWVQFPYSAKPTSDLPPGYRFLSAICVTDLHAQLGTAQKILRLGFVARRVYVVAAGDSFNQVGGGSSLLSAGGGGPAAAGLAVGGGLIAALIGGAPNRKSWILYDHSTVGLPDV